VRLVHVGKTFNRFADLGLRNHGEQARPTACLTYFHLRRTSVVCVLDDTVTSFPYVSIVSVKTLLFPDAYFIFL